MKYVIWLKTHIVTVLFHITACYLWTPTQVLTQVLRADDLETDAGKLKINQNSGLTSGQPFLNLRPLCDINILQHTVSYRVLHYSIFT